MDKKMAIVILGGGLIKDKKGQWRTTNFGEPGDNFGTMGDRIRVVAGYYFYKKNPDILIIASGGRGQFSHIKDAPPVAAVIKQELMEFGVPEEKIIEEVKSYNTYEQLCEIKKIARGKGWQKIEVISNKWHLPRVEAMIEKFEELNSLKTIYKLISAEEVLIKEDKTKWEPIIEQAYASGEMRRRIESEQKGVNDIEAGIYKK